MNIELTQLKVTYVIKPSASEIELFQKGKYKGCWGLVGWLLIDSRFDYILEDVESYYNHEGDLYSISIRLSENRLKLLEESVEEFLNNAEV